MENLFPTVPAILALCIISGYISNAEMHGDSADGRFISESDASNWPVRVRYSRIGGAVCGAYWTSYGGNLYASFRGVPYAKAPVGELRFLAPQPVEPWDGCFDATFEGPICPQRSSFMMTPRSIGEDCLRVNVHVPAFSLPAPGSQCIGDACLPVLVFVSGGGFQFGSGDSDEYGPEYMVDENVVMVSLNYRVGPFGFISLNTSSVPGNAGLRDIVAALEWVQNNIRAFGGDPQQVTLMGNSAGASAVHILSISKAITGLFTKVILSSGTSTVGFLSTKPSYSQSILRSFLEILNITSTDGEEINNQLIELPYETLVDTNIEVTSSQFGLGAFSPVVESEFEGVTRILDDDPDFLLAQGRGSNYPLLLGYTNKECETLRPYYERADVIAAIEENPTAILPVKLLFSATDEEQKIAAELMIETYMNGTLSMDNYIPVCSDSFFVYPALKLAETRATTGGAPVFLYKFTYNSDHVATKIAFGLNFTGAGHVEDLTYIVRVNSILNVTKLESNDESVKDWMTTIVSNFIRYSNPTGAESNDDAWPEVTLPLQNQLINGSVYAMTYLTSDQQAMMELFDSFYKV